MRRAVAAGLALALGAAACGDGDEGRPRPAAPTTVPAPQTTGEGRPTQSVPHGRLLASLESAGARLEAREVARDRDTVWSLAWDPAGSLWFTERSGRLTRVGGATEAVAGVVEVGEGGLMGLEIDGQGRRFLMYTGADDNRVVRLEADGAQTVLVSGIAKASIHNGGRLRFGPDGALYASTGDAAEEGLAPRADSLNGKVLRIDPDSGQATVFSRGHRNVQGLCFDPEGRFLATEHGPLGRDEVNVLVEGFDSGWPRTAGNGIRNYTASIAPAGCVVYDDDLIPGWRGSMLFATLREGDLRRLSFGPDGSVASEEVLLDDELGRLRDVGVGPDGAVYVATSNRDGRGDPDEGDDRIVRIAPAP